MKSVRNNVKDNVLVKLSANAAITVQGKVMDNITTNVWRTIWFKTLIFNNIQDIKYEKI